MRGERRRHTDYPVTFVEGEPVEDSDGTPATKTLDALRDKHAKVLEKLRRPKQATSTGGSSPTSSGYNTPVPGLYGFGLRAQDSAFGKALRGSCESTQSIYSQVTHAADDLRKDTTLGTSDLQASVTGHEATWNQFYEHHRASGMKPEQLEELIRRLAEVSGSDTAAFDTLIDAKAKLDSSEETHTAAGQEAKATLAELHDRMQGISGSRSDIKQQAQRMARAGSPTTRRRLASITSEMAEIKAALDRSDSGGVATAESKELSSQLGACLEGSVRRPSICSRTTSASPVASPLASREASPSNRRLSQRTASLTSLFEAQANALCDWQAELGSEASFGADSNGEVHADQNELRLQTLLAQGRAQLANLQKQNMDLQHVMQATFIPESRKGELRQQLEDLKQRIAKQKETHDSELASLRAERDRLNEELVHMSQPADGAEDGKKVDEVLEIERVCVPGATQYFRAGALLFVMVALGFAAVAIFHRCCAAVVMVYPSATLLHPTIGMMARRGKRQSHHASSHGRTSGFSQSWLGSESGQRQRWKTSPSSLATAPAAMLILCCCSDLCQVARRWHPSRRAVKRNAAAQATSIVRAHGAIA